MTKFAWVRVYSSISTGFFALAPFVAFFFPVVGALGRVDAEGWLKGTAEPLPLRHLFSEGRGFVLQFV